MKKKNSNDRQISHIFSLSGQAWRCQYASIVYLRPFASIKLNISIWYCFSVSFHTRTLWFPYHFYYYSAHFYGLYRVLRSRKSITAAIDMFQHSTRNERNKKNWNAIYANAVNLVCDCANRALEVWLMEIEIKVPNGMRFLWSAFLFSIGVIKTNKQIAVCRHCFCCCLCCCYSYSLHLSLISMSNVEMFAIKTK